IAVAFSATLERLGIPYVIGGSFASSVHGEPRSTNDIDFVVDLDPARLNRLVAALGTDYYVSADAAREAIASAGSFNAIHLGGGIKIDLFVAGGDPFHEERLAQRHPIRPQGHSGPTLYVHLPGHP